MPKPVVILKVFSHKRKMKRFSQLGLSTSIGYLVLIVLLTACGTGTSVPTQEHPSQVPASPTPPEETRTPTPFLPSPTSPPLAAQVNGEGITLEEYQEELARFRAASDSTEINNGEEVVLEDMVNQLLLAQGARKAGFVVDETFVKARIEELNLAEAALNEWLAANGYTQASFREAMARSIAAAWMRDQIIADVPETAEQVHARQILLYNSEEANEVYTQLEAGVGFETLVVEYDPQTLGDLGWFPRGYLSESTLTEAAFALEPGEYSPVIETRLGYHILQVIERDPQRPLSFDARRVLQVQAVDQWLQERREESEILILVP